VRNKILFRAGAILILLIIAGVMMIVGRGHTIYFDNKTLEYNGESYSTIRRINVLVNGEQVAKLSKKERGMATCMGQSFSFDLEVIREKDAEPEPYHFDLSLPYGMDGIIVNLPGIMAGVPQEAWMSEFIPAPPTETEEDELPTDEFDMGGEV
jgi:hypothetical protein